MLLGVDVGGTFTDAVLVAGGQLHTAKAPTTPADQSQAVMAAIEAVLAQAGAQPGDGGGGRRRFGHTRGRRRARRRSTLVRPPTRISPRSPPRPQSRRSRARR